MHGVIALLPLLTLDPTMTNPITHVERPPLAGRHAHYVTAREPLRPIPLLKLPVGSIRADGWLREQMRLMAEGMIGRLPAVSRWCDPENNAWLSPDGTGEHPWEEVPYWLRGLVSLAYTLPDDDLIASARPWIDGILNSQRDDGYFGPQANREKHDLWPNMVALNVLQQHYEATGDERVPPFMERYFAFQRDMPRQHLVPSSWQHIRAGDNLESVYWLYNRTGTAWLLDFARVLHRNTARWDNGIASWHGVNITQAYREPAVFFLQSGERNDLDAAERNYRAVMTLYGQVPGGMFGADENARAGRDGPRQAAETCSMVEFMNSFEQLLAITGDPVHADRCEDVAFNNLPAAFTPDYRGLHYLTAPNMVQLDQTSKSPGLDNGGTMLAYNPHRYRCCQHNHGFGWPYFAQHLWMATLDGGLAATMYAPCSVTATVGAGDGQEITLRVETEYPFDERIAITVDSERPVAFPLYLRLPGWADTARVSINDETSELARPAGGLNAGGSGRGYVRVERTWGPGDRVVLELPMQIDVTRWETNAGSVSVRRGPLWYALEIGERWERYDGTDEWPAFEIYPATPWNYGLVLDEQDPAGSFALEEQVRNAALPPQPFTPEAAPLALRVDARRIPGWQLDYTGLVGELQGSPARSDQPVERVRLIPMGCARLRISAFPVIGTGPEAYEWVAPPPPPHTASYHYDDLAALSDGRIPSSSADESIPRLTFWAHKGTVEWVTWRFERPRRVSACGVYWFDDRAIMGNCAIPQGWKVLYRDGETWKEVRNAEGYGVEPDRFNRVTFDPVETRELKLEIQLREGFSGGILEWTVEDEGSR